MCNRFRSIKEWSDIPRRFHSGPRLNFEFNPNVAPTELVPALVAGEDVVLARFGINRLGSADKPRPPLLNVRTDGMRKGQFRTGGIGFPERAGSAPLRRISPRTARQKCGRRRWLPWCISRSRTSKPRYGSVRLPPFLCFDCEPRPGACHIKENISHSRTRCRLCPL